MQSSSAPSSQSVSLKAGSTQSLPPVPLDCCFAPPGRPSKNASSPEPLSLTGRVPAAPAAPPSVVPEPLTGRLQGGPSSGSWPRPGPAPPPAA